jgi:hypothetical protein
MGCYLMTECCLLETEEEEKGKQARKERAQFRGYVIKDANFDYLGQLIA